MSSGIKIVFVTGASRSGTTMLSRILGRAKEVYWLRELHYFGDICGIGELDAALSDDKLKEMAARLLARQERGIYGLGPQQADYDAAHAIVKELPGSARTGACLYSAVMTKFTQDTDAVMVCEQTPRNILYAEKLLSLYPRAQFAHMVRDPRSVLASQKNRWRQRSMGRKKIPLNEMLRFRVNYHPITISKLWNRANKIASGLSDHSRCRSLRFEDVVANPEQEISRLCDFLDIRFDSDMLNIPKMGSSHMQNREEKGVSAQVVDQWKSVLTSGEVQLCENRCAPLMKRYSYGLTNYAKNLHPSVLVQFLYYPLHVLGVMLINPRRAWIQLNALLGIGGRTQ